VRLKRRYNRATDPAWSEIKGFINNGDPYQGGFQEVGSFERKTSGSPVQTSPRHHHHSSTNRSYQAPSIKALRGGPLDSLSSQITVDIHATQDSLLQDLSVNTFRESSQNKKLLSRHKQSIDQNRNMSIRASDSMVNI
jgi:hypothetical protein